MRSTPHVLAPETSPPPFFFGLTGSVKNIRRGGKHLHRGKPPAYKSPSRHGKWLTYHMEWHLSRQFFTSFLNGNGLLSINIHTPYAPVDTGWTWAEYFAWYIDKGGMACLLLCAFQRTGPSTACICWPSNEESKASSVVTAVWSDVQICICNRMSKYKSLWRVSPAQCNCVRGKSKW